MKTATLSQVLRGATGTGVGRVEAAEIARRYSKALGHNVVPQKWGGEWFFVSTTIGARLPLRSVVEDLFDMGEC